MRLVAEIMRMSQENEERENKGGTKEGSRLGPVSQAHPDPRSRKVGHIEGRKGKKP